MHDQLLQVKASKEEYIKALEAVHTDLKDSEAECDQLRSDNEQLRSRSKIFKFNVAGNSPMKKVFHEEKPQLRNQSTEKVEYQAGCIRFLLMENSRLKSLESAEAMAMLLHPADPVMTWYNKKMRPSVDNPRANVKEFKSLMTEAQHLMVNVRVPDLTKSDEESDWEYLQHKLQHRKLLKIVKRAKDLDEVQTSTETRPVVTIGEISIPTTAKGRHFNLDIQLDDLGRINDLLVC